MTGAGTDTCTVMLNAAAGAGGQPVSLSSNTAAVTVPSSVTVAAGTTTANFPATISSVGTPQTATLTASSGSETETYGISLTVTVGTATLTLQSTSVPFGNVTDGIPAYQSVTLTSSGTAPVTVSAGSVSGTGYAIYGVSFPLTLNPGASATLEIEFDPTTPGTADGAVTLTSNSSTGTMSTISLSGTGVAPSTVGTATLTLQSTSVPFGDVKDGIPAYQSVTLTSSGTAPVTVSAGSVSGTGYAISGVSLPLTLNPGASATLEIEFDPTTPGTAQGAVTLTSNSSAGTKSTISLSGTGVAPSYEVDITWNAPADSSDSAAGYNIYRAVSGSSTYQLLNASSDSATSYADVTVASNTSYTYYVESVDAEGNSSSPSNTFSVTVP